MANIKAVLQYDGTGFSGFQRQNNSQNSMNVGSNGLPQPPPRTVQQEIESVLRCLNKGEGTETFVAGRTDKGVHASGQVIHFQLPNWFHGAKALHGAMNSTLPPDISITSIEEVSPDFHARHSARFRRYEYTIFNHDHRSALVRNSAWHVPEPLDEDAMQEAANFLIGEHDFVSFGAPPEKRGHCVRTVLDIKVRRVSPCLIVVDVKGVSFLYHMVRNIVGSLRRVGSGKEPPARMKEWLEKRTRGACGSPAPAQGLVLVEIGYDENDFSPRRVKQDDDQD